MSFDEPLQLLEEIASAFKDLTSVRIKAERQLDDTSSQLEALLLSVRTLRNPEEYSSRFESPEATRERQPGSSPQPAPSSQESNEIERLRYEGELERTRQMYEHELSKMKTYYEAKIKLLKGDSTGRQKDYRSLTAQQMRRILAEQDKTIEYQEQLIQDLMKRVVA
jgi:hypothetical protein